MDLTERPCSGSDMEEDLISVVSSSSLPEEPNSPSSSMSILSPGLDMVIRRGSSCRVIHPLPTIVQPEHTDHHQCRTYVRKDELSEDEAAFNQDLFSATVANEFPEEDMTDRAFRDKDKDWVLKTWILRVLDEEPDSRRKERRLAQSEDLAFMLQSGIVLCKLISKLMPDTALDTDNLQSGNLVTKRKNIALFLKAATLYGVPSHLLFQPDDLAVQAHVYKVTRTLFVLAELTNLDPHYTGPRFCFDNIIKELIDQGIRRKSSVQDVARIQTNINNIFANLMQDVERRTSLAPRGPPSNIYYCD